jgi:SIR2-like domain
VCPTKTEDAYYLGGEFMPLDKEENKARFVQRLRQYLELRNLNVLIGNGCSLPLGAPRIGNTADLLAELDVSPYQLTNAKSQKRARTLLGHLLPKKRSIGVEPLLTVLANVQANEQLLQRTTMLGGVEVPTEDARCLESLLKKWLFHKCKALTAVSDVDLRFHEELLRRILLRSTTLPRAKIFTLNYDLLLERALDNLGVLYFDGFLGTINRTLRTESYHYDLYYPGETTEGRVSRVDRVLHLYKLHGSINWRRRSTAANDVIISHAEPMETEYGDVMIYPSPLKVTEMNGYPYSEMFRHFSSHIHQPQSVLITIGYSFQDSHINRLIYQALSIPSFVLIIVTPNVLAPEPGTPADTYHETWRLKELKSKRILIVTGSEKDAAGQYIRGAGTMQDFSTTWLPDITELNVEATAREEVRKIFEEAKPSEENNGG